MSMDMAFQLKMVESIASTVARTLDLVAMLVVHAYIHLLVGMKVEISMYTFS